MITKDLVYFDLETTDSDPNTARIVQGAFSSPGKEPLVFTCNPGVPIEPGAQEAHGISMADVADEEGFDYWAGRVQALVQGSVLVGYNCRRFDTVILHNELKRVGHKGLKTDAFGDIVHPEIDLYLCWLKMEPRTLVGALDRFGLKIDFDAHDAWEDTRVLDPLMYRMLGKFGVDLEKMVSTSNPEDEIDRDGKLRRREDGKVELSFGKHSGVPLERVPRDYLRWITEANFSDSTKAAVRRFLGTGTL